MGWYFRKSIRSGPLRVNVSKSGVGVSAGVRGARVGIGPRGPYLAGGLGGLYFRKRLSGGRRANRISPLQLILLVASIAGLLWYLSRAAYYCVTRPWLGIAVAGALMAIGMTTQEPALVVVGVVLFGGTGIALVLRLFSATRELTSASTERVTALAGSSSAQSPHASASTSRDRWRVLIQSVPSRSEAARILCELQPTLDPAEARLRIDRGLLVDGYFEVGAGLPLAEANKLMQRLLEAGCVTAKELCAS